MGDSVVLRVVVANPNGVHARPSHAIVSAAREFAAQVELRCDGRRADARSILAVMTLGAAKGAEIEVHASGADAEAAAKRVAELLASAEA